MSLLSSYSTVIPCRPETCLFFFGRLFLSYDVWKLLTESPRGNRTAIQDACELIKNEKMAALSGLSFHRREMRWREKKKVSHTKVQSGLNQSSLVHLLLTWPDHPRLIWRHKWTLYSSGNTIMSQNCLPDSSITRDKRTRRQKAAYSVDMPSCWSCKMIQNYTSKQRVLSDSPLALLSGTTVINTLVHERYPNNTSSNLMGRWWSNLSKPTYVV